MSVEQTIVHVGDSAASRIYRRQQVLFVVVLGAYLCLSLRVASERLFWFDELFTLYTARFESLPALWHNLQTGSELNPPLYYVASHCAVWLLGENEMTLRLPATLGYGVLVWCTFQFVGRRWGALQGWLAALFVLGSNITYYSFEARPYGLALGFAGVALLCWQRATSAKTGRRAALVGLALTLGLGLSTHYYFLLVFIPLGLAELVRTAETRRVDPALSGALLAGLASLVLYVPLLTYARSCAVSFWAPASWEGLPVSYGDYLGRLMLPLVVALGLLAFSRGRAPDGSSPTTITNAEPRPFEITVVLALAALPVFAILLGKLATGAYTPRYAVFAVPGLGILFSFAVVRLAAARPAPVLNVIVLMCGWFVFVEHCDYCAVKANARTFADTCNVLRRHGGGEAPVVYAEYHFFLQVNHYDPVLASRAVCIASFDLPLRHHTHITDDGALTKLARLVPLHVEDYEAFTRTHGKFLLFGENPWLHKELLERGARLTLVADCPDGKLFEVETDWAASLALRAGRPDLERMISP
jgi:hypothetical protein